VTDIDRRDFFKQAGGLAVVAGAASFGFPGGLERAIAAAGGGLTPARRRTYRALVEAVGSAPGNQVQRGAAAQATTAFAAGYEDRFPEVRRYIDSVLDTVESAPGGRRFSRLDPADRLRLLRDRLTGSDGDAQRAATSDALALATTTFQPEPDNLRPAPVVL
jgi:hypothetical protein